LKLCLDRGLTSKDEPRIEEKPNNANDAMMAFLDWCEGRTVHKTGAAGPLAAALDFFRNMSKDSTEANRKAIAMLQAELEQCRLGTVLAS
jgi:hypothetical protein